VAPTANCLVPATFLANFEYCEPKLCTDYLWRIKYLNASTSDRDDPTAYDVCRSACSYLSLGEPGDNETQTMRTRCQDRCYQDGYGSFACQAYCTDYPMDKACPRPGCTTVSSMQANLEYCSQNICDAFFPVLDPPLSGQNATTYDVCKRACSAQQLGPMGTPETDDQRQRCRNLCVIDGVEKSLVCLGYCLSFPDDTSACPPPETVAAIMQEKMYTAPPSSAPTTVPTAPPTQTPTVAPTTQPTAHPTLGPTADPTASPSLHPTTRPTVGGWPRMIECFCVESGIACVLHFPPL
jgi:cell division septation protein DedD